MSAARKSFDGAFLGWRCTRLPHADGPCSLVPKWWNIRGVLANKRSQSVPRLLASAWDQGYKTAMFDKEYYSHNPNPYMRDDAE